MSRLFLQSYDSASRLSPTSFPLSCQQLVSLSQSSCVSAVELTDGRCGGKGLGKEPNRRLRESLALYNPFNTLLTDKKTVMDEVAGRGQTGKLSDIANPYGTLTNSVLFTLSLAIFLCGFLILRRGSRPGLDK